jgi:hypothetical protein
VRIALVVTHDAEHDGDVTGGAPRPVPPAPSAPAPTTASPLVPSVPSAHASANGGGVAEPMELSDDDIDLDALDTVPPEHVKTTETLLHEEFPGSSFMDER